MLESQYKIHDERFRACIRTHARIEKLYEGCRWAEGPVWFPMLRTLLWSDIPNNRMMRWDEATACVSTFRSPSNYTNGHTIGRQGRLVSCEHGGRRVVRTEHDGSLTVLAAHYDGKRLNSPNDVVVTSENSVWFTDPTYGIDTDYEGHKAEAEQDGSHVYRIDPRGHVTRVLTDFVKPNGLAFSPDERKLYVVDSGRTHLSDGPRHIRVFDVAKDWSLSGGAVFADNGNYDGLRVDSDGRVWTSASEAVHCYMPDGTLIGEIYIGEPVSNVCFGGEKRNRLFITATTSVYSVMLAINGAKTF